MSDDLKNGNNGLGGLLPRYRTPISCLVHIILFGLAFFCAFALYYNLRSFDLWFVPFFLPFLPLIVSIKTIVFASMRLFRGTWRYVGMRDLWTITMASFISTSLFILAFFAIDAFFPEFFESRPRFPQSAFPLDLISTIAVVGGARLLFRLYNEEIRPVSSGDRRRCLILGAGDTGEALLREILRMRRERYDVVGFLDDDPAKRGTEIHGVPILGPIDQARSACEQHKIQELLLAMPRASQKTLRKIIEQCQGLSVLFRTIPAMEAVIEGKVTVSQIRDVDIKDLLGREQVELDTDSISDSIRGEDILVTGAGGSIGAELCRQIARFRPRRLVLVEQAENNLFEIDRDLQRRFPELDCVCCVADICDVDRIDRILETRRPALIFHSAAHKHVPMMEINVGEAIKNNILGTRTVADAARKHKVRRFVMISTDKAVNPTSVMGCTKRVAEMYIQQLRRDGITHFMTVRFGNVLGSSGSVVPIFAKQIADGGPVTVTDRRMTRYFMTIPEAAQLVLQAGVMGKDGDIFVLDMGEPVKIVDLAREMIALSGMRPGEDIELQFTGIRPGEKLFEELSVAGEDMGPTSHKKIYVWRNTKADWAGVCRAMDALIAGADEATSELLRDRLQGIVPEYQPQSDAPTEATPKTADAATTEPPPAAPQSLPFGESPAT